MDAKIYKVIPFEEVAIKQCFENALSCVEFGKVNWVKYSKVTYDVTSLEDNADIHLKIEEGDFPAGCLVRIADCKPELDGWQPIDTAPQDGTEILLSDADFVFSGEYDLNYGRFGMFTHDGLVEYQHPSHWMPLPGPPKAKEGAS
jgi:hypothetical protein